MNTLVIYAHPDTESHCKHIKKEVETYLISNNFSFKIIDLYRLNYNPVLLEKELYTSGNKFKSKQTINFQKEIKSADKIIIIYPTWWGTMPAILKGFFDKTFTNGFAFSFKRGSKLQTKLLENKAVVITTTGAPTLYSKYFAKVGDLCQKNILKFCGIKSKTFILGDCKKYHESRLPKIKKLVKKSMNYLY